MIRQQDAGFDLSENPLTSTYNCLVRKNSYPALPSNSKETCSGTSYTEGGAQIWAARTLGNYLKANPPRTTLEALSVFAPVAGDLFPSTKKGTKSPADKTRDFNAIYLSIPAVQAALNCNPVAHQNCAGLFDPGKPSTSGISTDTHIGK